MKLTQTRYHSASFPTTRSRSTHPHRLGDQTGSSPSSHLRQLPGLAILGVDSVRVDGALMDGKGAGVEVGKEISKLRVLEVRKATRWMSMPVEGRQKLQAATTYKSQEVVSVVARVSKVGS